MSAILFPTIGSAECRRYIAQGRAARNDVSAQILCAAARHRASGSIGYTCREDSRRRDAFRSFPCCSIEFLQPHLARRRVRSVLRQRVRALSARVVATTTRGSRRLVRRSTSTPRFSTTFLLDFDLDLRFLLQVARLSAQTGPASI